MVHTSSSLSALLATSAPLLDAYDPGLISRLFGPDRELAELRLSNPALAKAAAPGARHGRALDQRHFHSVSGMILGVTIVTLLLAEGVLGIHAADLSGAAGQLALYPLLIMASGALIKWWMGSTEKSVRTASEDGARRIKDATEEMKRQVGAVIGQIEEVAANVKVLADKQSVQAELLARFDVRAERMEKDIEKLQEHWDGRERRSRGRRDDEG